MLYFIPFDGIASSILKNIAVLIVRVHCCDMSCFIEDIYDATMYDTTDCRDA